MTHFSTSDQAMQVREHLGTRVYMASHPKLRPYMRRGLRPLEFGDRIWPAALYLMSQVVVEAKDRVLEIGCGWGLVGIHLARAYGARVTCTDLDNRLRPFVEAHADLNGVSVPFENRSFDDLRRRPIAADVIVGSDICYSDDVMRDLVRLIDASAREGVGRFVLTDQGRPDFDGLVAHCQARFHCERSRLDDPVPSRSINLLDIHLRASASA